MESLNFDYVNVKEVLSIGHVKLVKWLNILNIWKDEDMYATFWSDV